jgi:hypothetical protein
MVGVLLIGSLCSVVAGPIVAIVANNDELGMGVMFGGVLLSVIIAKLAELISELRKTS